MQLFSNNASTTLAATLTAEATALTVATDTGDLFSSPSGFDFELITLTDGAEVEIVKVTGRTADELTVERGQEGTVAREWLADTLVEGRLTAGTLQSALLGLDFTGDPIGDEALSLQPGRDTSDQVASGGESVAIGYATKAMGFGATALGSYAKAMGFAALAVGYDSEASVDEALAIGNSAVAASEYSIAIGNYTYVEGEGCLALGYSASVEGSAGIAIGSEAYCDNANALTIGYKSKVSTDKSSALGSGSAANIKPTGAPFRQASTAVAWGAEAYYTSGGNTFYLRCAIAGTTAGSPPAFTSGYIQDGTVTWLVMPIKNDSTTAVGTDSRAMGGRSTAAGVAALASEDAVAVGTNAEAGGKRAIALGYAATARHESSIVLGVQNSILDKALHVGALPVMGTPPDGYLQNAYKSYCALEGYLQSDPIDLTGGAAWSATTAVSQGQVMRPTIPDGHQYVRYCNNYQIGLSPDLAPYTPGETGATEPAWVTNHGGLTNDGDGSWVCVHTDGAHVLNLPDGAYMLVSEVAFIAYEADNVSVQPTLSIGTTGDLTKLINAEQTVGLTDDMTVYKFTLTQPFLVPDITLKIDTLATGTRLLGRFHVKGVLTRHWL